MNNISRRDYFAGLAMQGILSAEPFNPREDLSPTIVSKTR